MLMTISKLNQKLQEAYEKYGRQTEEENPDRQIDYHEEVAALIDLAICHGCPFAKVAETLSSIEEFLP